MRIRHCNKCVCDDEKFQDSRRHVNLSAIKNKINAKTIKKKKTWDEQSLLNLENTALQFAKLRDMILSLDWSVLHTT